MCQIKLHIRTYNVNKTKQDYDLDEMLNKDNLKFVCINKVICPLTQDKREKKRSKLFPKFSMDEEIVCKMVSCPNMVMLHE